MDHLRQLISFIACFGLLAMSGCTGGSSDIASVTGKVTIGGEPINYASITFMPTQGRASVGLTDSEGVYTLNYVIGQKGALIGEHKVYVTTRVVKEPSYGGDDTGGIKDPVRNTGRKELLPKKYCDRRATELTATVKEGSNTINFDLKTK